MMNTPAKFLMFILMMLASPQRLWSYTPILPIAFDINKASLLELALRSPDIEQSAITDDLYFEQTFEQVKAQEAELPSLRGIAYTDALRTLYIDYIKMIYFLEDLRIQRYTSTASYSDIKSKVSTLRNRMKSYAQRYAQGKIGRKEKARALYHILTHDYLEGLQQSQSIQRLSKIQAQLNSRLKSRSELLFLYDEGLQREKTQNTLRLSSIAKGLNTKGAIAAFLTQAKIYAGLNYRGQTVRSPQKSYIRALREVSRRVHHLSVTERDHVFVEMLSIMNRIHKGKSEWSSPPFNIKPFQDSKSMLALVERRALYQLRRGKTTEAIKIYSTLSDQFVNTKKMIAFDSRILGLYKNTKTSITDYSHHLIEYKSKYDATSLTGQDVEKIKQEIRKDHRRLVYKNLQAADGKKKSSSAINETIAATDLYLQTYQIDQAEKNQIDEMMANAYVSLGMLPQAVRLYTDLKTRAQDLQNQKKFLKLAIKYQAVVAKWSQNQPPWAGFKGGDPQERDLLAKLYLEFYDKQKSWSALAHLGLLYTDLGRGEEAFQLWKDGFTNNPKHRQARLAAGYMSKAYIMASRWGDLESLCRKMLELRVIPRFRGKNLPVRDMLADALFNGGKQLYADQKYKTSTEKLDEFIRNYKKDKRRAEAYFILGQGQHFAGTHIASIETMMNLVNEYPSSKFTKEALILGHKWSRPMAFEDQGIFFAQKFIDRYPQDNRSLAIRRELIELYEARELFGNAARVYQDISLDKRESIENQIEATLAFVKLEERYGDEKDAQWGLNRLQELSPNDSYVQAKQLSFKVRAAMHKKDLAQVIKLEKELSQIASSEREVIEATAEARLIIARSQIKQLDSETVNISLKDPQKILESKYQDFISTKNKLQAVCEAGTSSYCAKAMLDLSNLCYLTLQQIDDISLPQTLSDNELGKFDDLKLSFIDALTETSRDADNAALGMSDNGETTPDIARQVYWNNYEEWDHEADNPSSGNGYVQWQPASLK